MHQSSCVLKRQQSVPAGWRIYFILSVSGKPWSLFAFPAGFKLQRRYNKVFRKPLISEATLMFKIKSFLMCKKKKNRSSNRCYFHGKYKRRDVTPAAEYCLVHQLISGASDQMRGRLMACLTIMAFICY